MIEIKEVKFEGYDAVSLSNQNLTLWATVSAGPRILGLSAFGGGNLLAVLPGVALDFPGEGSLELIGGHRLWYAPEIPERTYIPDGKPVSWAKVDSGIELTQPVEQATGMQKQIRIELDRDGARAIITHRLSNQGKNPFDLAPWAITQVKPGGVGVLPLKMGNADPHGLLPNREIVLWPYTPIGSEHLSLTDAAIFVHANMKKAALKVGASNPVGWIAYAVDDQMFVKRSAYIEGGNYLDRGASSQIYCNQDFLELETLSPLVMLQPGEGISHIERWEVYPSGAWPNEIAEVIRLGLAEQS